MDKKILLPLLGPNYPKQLDSAVIMWHQVVTQRCLQLVRDLLVQGCREPRQQPALQGRPHKMQDNVGHLDIKDIQH
ncbi:hypothetical protein ANN_18483 [Periplaneta americana]|uniref:Uncharacterized protein n=1 Tax=Periplaneta americana TaxID=6978 RepID=A0ABQ8SPD1_PERAM|nr:hypothetical protein ANN_18483 [Periplaneta americana]